MPKWTINRNNSDGRSATVGAGAVASAAPSRTEPEGA